MLGVGTKYVDSYDGKQGKHLPVCDCIVRENKEKTDDSNRSKGRRGGGGLRGACWPCQRGEGLNMLIAMMGSTYQSVIAKSENGENR